MPNGISTDQPPDGDHVMEVEVNPPYSDRLELTPGLVRWSPVPQSIRNEFGRPL